MGTALVACCDGSCACEPSLKYVQGLLCCIERGRARTGRFPDQAMDFTPVFPCLPGVQLDLDLVSLFLLEELGFRLIRFRIAMRRLTA